MKKSKSRLLKAVISMAVAVTSIPFFSVSAQTNGVRGDANSNGKTDVRDCSYIANALAHGKGDSLPETADYNRDGKRNVSDAANLARDVAAGNIKTYKSAPVIPGLEIGMTTNEVFSVIGTDYTHDYKSDIHVNEDIIYYYNIDKVEAFNINIPSVMFVEFSDGILYNFGYHIGMTMKSEYETIYTDDINALTTAYDKIFNILTDYYGKSSDTELSSAYGAIKENSWTNTDYGDLWMLVGENLWSSDSHVNEILISSCQQSLAGAYKDF